MTKARQSSNVDIRTFFVGIEYDSFDEDKGFFDIRRTVTLKELAWEVGDYLINGKRSYPAFPARSNPSVLFALDMEDPENGDIYNELMAAIKSLSIKKAA